MLGDQWNDNGFKLTALGFMDGNGIGQIQFQQVFPRINNFLELLAGLELHT